MSKEHLIKKYLHGELNENEELEFIQHLEADEDFAEEVKLQSLMYAKRSIELKDFLSSEASPKTLSEMNAQISIFKILRNIAAIFILGAISYFSYHSLTKQNDHNILNELYSEKFVSPGLLLSVEDDNTWNKAISFYSNGNYIQAEQELLKIGNRNVEQELYLALSGMYKESPNFEKSIRIFERILDHPDNVDQDATSWYLTIAYLKNGQKNLAKQILEKIASSDHYKKDDAIKAMRYFEKM